MTTYIGKSTLSHRIHGLETNDPDGSNKEYTDNQEDAINDFKDPPENYKPLIILHIEREIVQATEATEETEKVTITRLDNGGGMNNVDVYIDPSNSTTKKNLNGNFLKGMFNSSMSLHPKRQMVISRGSQKKANSLIFYPQDMLKMVFEGLVQDKTFNDLDIELDTLIEHEYQDHPNPKTVINWDELKTKNGDIINEEILKIKNGGRGTIQIQKWEKDCPLTKEIIEKYNNCLRYKKKNFTPTYIFNNKVFNIEKNCFIPNDYSIIDFGIQFLYDNEKFEKLFVKLPNDKIIYCKKNETNMSDYCEEGEICFDQHIKFKIALVSSEFALKQKTDLNINFIGELKRPIIETSNCLLGIGKVVYSTAYNHSHLFNCSENIHPRSSFQIPSNLYKKFGVGGNKDKPNLSCPDIEIKKLLANFVKPLYKYLINNFGKEKKEIGNKGIRDVSVWNFDEMKNYILNKKKMNHKKTKTFCALAKTHTKKKGRKLFQWLIRSLILSLIQLILLLIPLMILLLIQLILLLIQLILLLIPLLILLTIKSLILKKEKVFREQRKMNYGDHNLGPYMKLDVYVKKK